MRFSITGIFLALLIAFAALTCGWLWSQGRPAAPADYAAWAQAITGTAAMVVTFFVVIWQNQLQVQREDTAARRRKADLMEAAFQLATYVKTVCENLIEYTTPDMIPESHYCRKCAAELQAIGVAFEKYNPADFANYDELQPLVALMAARSSIALALDSMLPKMDDRSMLSPLRQAVRGCIESIEKNLLKLKENADSAKKKI